VREFKASDWKEGDRVVTRSGDSVRILCVDRTGHLCVVGTTMPLETLIYQWNEFGKYHSTDGVESKLDLFVKPKPITMWVNVYRDEQGEATAGTIMDTFAKAETIKHENSVVAKIEWEE